MNMDMDMDLDSRVREMDFEHDIVQLVVSEAVRAAMETSLREPILRGVKQSTEEAVVETVAGEEDGGGTGKSKPVMAAQGLVVFLVMIVVLYVSFKRLTGDESS